MPRPKGSKKMSSSPSSSILLSNTYDLIINKGGRPKKSELIDDNIIPTSSSSEISGGRVVVNPAVLRYLEQNRSYSSIINKSEELFNENLSVNEGKNDLIKILSNEQYISINEFIQDDIFCEYSTEFLTTARLAEWILNHQQTKKLLN